MQKVRNTVPLTIMLGTESATNSYKEGMQSLETAFLISFGMQISFQKKEGRRVMTQHSS